MRWKELLLGLTFLGIMLMLIGFTVTNNSNMLTTYIYLDGAFVLKNQPFYLDQNTYPDLIVGRYILNKDTLVGTKATFIWNEKELTGSIIRVVNNVVYVNVSGFIYRVPLSAVALERIDTIVEVIPNDLVGVGVKSLKWNGETILYYGEDQSTLDIGVKIVNNGDWKYIGPIYLISTPLPRERYLLPPIRGYAKALSADLEAQPEPILNSKISYRINNIKIDPYQTLSRSLKQHRVDVERRNSLDLSIWGSRKGEPLLKLYFTSPDSIPPGNLAILDEKGRYLYYGNVEEIPPNKTISFTLFPNPQVSYNYTTHTYTEDNVTTIDYTLSLINYNNIEEPVTIKIALPSYGRITVEGDIPKQGNALVKEIVLLPSQSVTFQGRVIIRK